MNTVLDRGLDRYQLALPGFEGPLDVLVRLIERNQLPVTSISILSVTGQFLDHFAGLMNTDPSVMAEFSSVAARLLVLKSRALIPRPDPEPPDIEVDLVEQVREHQALRRAAGLLQTIDRNDRMLFPTRGGRNESNSPLFVARLAPHEPTLLSRALLRRIASLPPATTTRSTPPRVTLQQMAIRLLDHLRERGRWTLRQVFGPMSSRDEEIAGFLALLVLIRRRVVDASQDVRFGDIFLQRSGAQQSPDALFDDAARYES